MKRAKLYLDDSAKLSERQEYEEGKCIDRQLIELIRKKLNPRFKSGILKLKI